MNTLSPELFLSILALTGAVIVVSALLSGVVQRTGFPQVAVFLALGAVIGPAGLDMFSAGVESPVLRVVSTLSLVLVLFTDAVALDIGEVRKHRFLSFLILVPGTLASAFLVAVAGWWLLGLSATLAVTLGAALASTDPVLLRDLLHRPGLGSTVRQALRIEAGMNDAVLLPIILTAIAIHDGATGAGQWAGLAFRVLLLSPVAGAVVAWIAVLALTWARAHMGVRRDYESLYSLGIAFAAFATAEALHGSGFLAAFAAGLAVSALDVELCDCFLEYGETTAEMALLFTFVLFGTSLIWTGLSIVSGGSVLFIAAVLLARPAAFLPALAPIPLKARDRALIAWFGPRGLSSLLLVLLPVFAGVEGAAQLVPICCLVVLVSVVLHGTSSMVLLPSESAGQPSEGTPPLREPAVSRTQSEPTDPEYVTIPEVRQYEQSGAHVIFLDARTRRSYDESDKTIAGAIRLSPEFPVNDAYRLRIPRDALLPVFCT
jgi:NhaP-type Na+/H+ or K+/H+ antiporter